MALVYIVATSSIIGPSMEIHGCVSPALSYLASSVVSKPRQIGIVPIRSESSDTSIKRTVVTLRRYLLLATAVVEYLQRYSTGLAPSSLFILEPSTSNPHIYCLFFCSTIVVTFTQVGIFVQSLLPNPRAPFVKTFVSSRAEFGSRIWSKN